MLEEFSLDKKYETVEGAETNFSGQKILKKINYILKDYEENLELKKDQVVLGIKRIDKDIELKWKSDMNEWVTYIVQFSEKSYDILA